MEEEFVPYRLAVKLKPLGFDKPGFGYYYTVNGKDWKFAERSEYTRLDDAITIGGNSSLLAPTFSQAFRWFREKHSWTIDIKQVTKSNWSYTLNNFPKEITYYGELYDTYEEAELACLQKLIKIVETKS